MKKSPRHKDYHSSSWEKRVEVNKGRKWKQAARDNLKAQALLLQDTPLSAVILFMAEWYSASKAPPISNISSTLFQINTYVFKHGKLVHDWLKTRGLLTSLRLSKVHGLVEIEFANNDDAVLFKLSFA